jgi:hypothetical protein
MLAQNASAAADFKVAANELSWHWTQNRQRGQDFIGSASDDIKRISSSAPKPLECGDFLGLLGLGMEPANHTAGSTRRSTAAAGQETFKR